MSAPAIASLSADGPSVLAAASAAPVPVLPPTRAVLVGAGQRGIVYSNYALDHPELLTIVAVAEPHAGRRAAIAEKFGLAPEAQFEGWEALLAKRDVWDTPAATNASGSGEAAAPSDPAAASAAAPIVILATPDRAHHLPAVAFARAGFHVLLEKPMAVKPDECEAIAAAAAEAQQAGMGVRIFAVCHVLRYTPVNLKIRSLIASGAIGQLANIQHLEPIGASHFAHSYVRGNWRSEKDSTFSLMAKSCHDIDLMQYWAEAQGTDNPVTSVSSFGSLLHFRPEHKPPAATDRCLTCPAEPSCAYSGQKIYLEPLRQGAQWKGWHPNYLALVDTAVPDIENVTAALARGPYGECVYNGLNDVVDQQVVNLCFAGGQTASFTMVAFTSRTCDRQTRVYGSKGQIECDGESVEWTDFVTGEKKVFHPLTDVDEASGAAVDCGRLSGHGGADFFLMRSFVDAVRRGDASLISSGAARSLVSHRVVFAAEKARQLGHVVHLQQEEAGQAAAATAAVANAVPEVVADLPAATAASDRTRAGSGAAKDTARVLIHAMHGSGLTLPRTIVSE